MKKSLMLWILGSLSIMVVAGCSGSFEQETMGDVPQMTADIINEVAINQDSSREQLFASNRLKTNTALADIPLDQILDGGPGKDGIPAISNPDFIDVQAADGKSYLNDGTLGMVLSDGDTMKFYPYSILNWHEIVNDTVNGEAIAVTFCPLCGSAITFKREITNSNGNTKTLEFGVSGKLYQSNLLMYDRETESLWSQSLARAVVGDYLGTELEIVESDVMTWKQFKDNNNNGLVLSDATGYKRAYHLGTPYGDYDESELLYFPVDNEDVRLPAKTLLVIVNDDNISVAFHREKILDGAQGQIIVDGVVYKASSDNKANITITKDGVPVPSYVEMWFSWINKHYETENSKRIWGIE